METICLEAPIESSLQVRTGRPSDFTQETRTAILEAVKLGLPEGRAAELCGLDPSTLAHWKARGRQEQVGPYADFLIELKEADAHCERALLATVRKAAEDPKHWSAAMSLLERKWPKRWSRGNRASGLTTEEIIQRTLINQRAIDMLNSLKKERDRIEKELVLNEQRKQFYVDHVPINENKERLEKEKERIESQTECLLVAVNT